MGTTVDLQRAVPILRIFSVDKAKNSISTSGLTLIGNIASATISRSTRRSRAPESSCI